MSNSGEGSSETTGHKYHIHSSPVGDDYLADTGRCSSTAGHWNPYDVAVSGMAYLVWFIILLVKLKALLIVVFPCCFENSLSILLLIF